MKLGVTSGNLWFKCRNRLVFQVDKISLLAMLKDVVSARTASIVASDQKLE